MFGALILKRFRNAADRLENYQIISENIRDSNDHSREIDKNFKKFFKCGIL